MAILGFEIEEIVRLLALIEARGLDEFVWEDGERSIRIRGPRAEKPVRAEFVAPEPPTLAARAALPPAPRPRSRALAKARPSGEIAADEVALTAPMVGTFYRAEKPGAPPLVEIGQTVEVGQTVGVIEAMKVFSEFQAEHAGTIVAIPAKDGELVQVGTPLILLRKD